MSEAIPRAIEDLSDDSPIKKYLLNIEVSMINKWLTAEFSVPRHEEHLREEGRAEERAETARRMLKNGKLSEIEIAEYSGLPIEEVQKLADGN